MDAETILQRCQLFAQVSPDRRSRLAELAVVKQFSKGQSIFRQGDPCPGVYCLGGGLVRVFKIGPNGKEHVLHMVEPGNSFAEVAAIGGFDCPAHAEALEDAICCLIPVEAFRKAMNDDHQLCLEMMAGLSFWVRHLIALMEDLVLRDAIGRVARYLVESEMDEFGCVRLPALKRYVASHLNLTSETFSRTLSRLIEGGMIVELEGNRVRLEDRAAMQNIADGLFPRI